MPLFLISALLAGNPCFGASIEVAPLDNSELGLIIVTGPFEYSDIEQFQSKTLPLSKAIVMFSSNGGNLEAGIQIGRMIRMKGFLSLVLHTTWHTDPYRGGSIELSLGGHIDLGKTERIEIAVAQRLLDQRVS